MYHVRVIRRNNTFRWQVLSKNSRIVLTSEPCKSISGAQRMAFRYAKHFRNPKVSMKLPASVDRVRVR